LIATAGDDTTIKIWDWKLGKWCKTLFGHSNSVQCLCLLKSNEIIASGSAHENCSIKIW
jgi:WD40 repeat protein